MPFFDFVEVGTSDFGSEIEKADDETRGISIEPMLEYLDKLPQPKNCIKVNAAISNTNGLANIFFIPAPLIAEHQLPEWLKGCNAIGKPHPTCISQLEKKGLDPGTTIHMRPVSMMTLGTCLQLNEVSGLYQYKSDTEGHDTVILNNFLDDLKDPALLPQLIIFESNELSSAEEIEKTIARLVETGYVVEMRAHDTVLRLNLQQIKKTGTFSEEIPNYFLNDYPPGYRPDRLPHENTLEGAKAWCKEHNLGGITLQYNRYEVRVGNWLKPFREEGLKSWIQY